MRNVFKSYYTPTEQEFKYLWDNCLFTFDSCFLLDFYRLPENEVQELKNILGEIKIRIWLTHQVGYEYHKNRMSVIREMSDKYDEFISTLENGFQEIIKKMNNITKHPIINKEELEDKISNSKNIIAEYLKDLKKTHPNYWVNDTNLKLITDLFHGKVGTEYNQKDLDAFYKEGEERYRNKIPPGYKDKNKEKSNDNSNNNNEYGDLIIWKQIIDKARLEKKPIIFITSDGKEDWFSEIKGSKIGPRTELFQEFFANTEQQFYMYTTDKFMKYAKEYLKIKINDNTIKILKDLSLDRIKNLDTSNFRIPAGMSSISENFQKLYPFISLYESFPFNLSDMLRASLGGGLSSINPSSNVIAKLAEVLKNNPITLADYFKASLAPLFQNQKSFGLSDKKDLETRKNNETNNNPDIKIDDKEPEL